jgi:hypothetical protein
MGLAFAPKAHASGTDPRHDAQAFGFTQQPALTGGKVFVYDQHGTLGTVRPF